VDKAGIRRAKSRIYLPADSPVHKFEPRQVQLLDMKSSQSMKENKFEGFKKNNVIL